MTIRKIEDFGISKIPKRKTFKIHKKSCKYLVCPLVKLHTKKLKTPKMARRKIEKFGIKKTKTKNLPNS